MTMGEAIEILGINRTRDGDLRPMVRALSLMSWFNTVEDARRLAAGRYVLRNWRAYAAACNARRDAIFSRRTRKRA